MGTLGGLYGWYAFGITSLFVQGWPGAEAAATTCKIVLHIHLSLNSALNSVFVTCRAAIICLNKDSGKITSQVEHDEII